MRSLRTLCALTLLAAIVACGPGSNRPDAGDDDGNMGTPLVDAFGNGKFGQQCTTSDDCGPGGYCVEGNNGEGICTSTCDATCPDRFDCRAADVAGTVVSVCMPETFDYCKPCTDDLQCNGGVCVQLDGEGFCLPDCPFEGQCATGYSCKPDPSGEHAKNLCVPDTGSCSCTAAQAGQQRTCQTSNAAGTCYGFETCNPGNGGWSGCTAPTASTEICDGMDNDCDQLIDDGVSGSACPITNGFGTCQGVQVCNGTSFTCTGTAPAMEKCNYVDDDCDGSIDEPWPTLSDVCSAGIGSCTRFGVIRCDAAGTGIECSAVMGAPMTETCNGLDDNCNNQVDEPFKTGGTALGNTCSAGVGACLRQGNYVCAANGASTVCSVTAGPTSGETCNLVDDDCDSKIDENFKNLSGQYDKDTSCGSCSTDCTVLYALPNASGKCVVSGAPACQLQCAANAFNANGQTADGCELVLDPGAIYVSTDDPAAIDDATCGLGPVGTGAGNYPCKTITQGLSRATATGRVRVRVANGNYAETVTLVNGKSLLGGHRTDNWQRNVAGTSTVISGVGTVAATNHDYTVFANGISSATTFEGFVVLGSVNAKSRGNSYAIYVVSSSANLSILSNTIYGGRGGLGTAGGSGTSGTTGVNGTGRPSNPTGYDAKVTTGTGACDAAANDRMYANGGVKSCGADVVSGGNGGGNHCAPRPAYKLEVSGIDGFVGQLGDPTLGGAGGAGQDAGDDGALVRDGSSPNSPQYCLVPPVDYGLDGLPGADAGHGPSGAGCSAATGSVSGGHWTGSTAGTGGTGGNGGGGGGGGAGGGGKCAAAMEFCKSAVGANCTAYFNSCADGHDRLGAHGGGGGSGGCGGTGGGPATAGGGSFAIFITGGTAPVVTGNTIIRGEGGGGGVGGPGGNGGIGGAGAAGGTTAVFCAGAAGRGGNGGDGGHGAGGGGGCGGASFGIFTSGVGAPNYCQAAAANAISSGAGGAGGAGGYSLINTGGTGAAGTLGTCQFN